MSLIAPKKLFSVAREAGFAVGFFESWDIASTQGVIDAAEEANAPVIIGFNGEFMSSDERVSAERIEWYGALGQAAVRTARIPCGFVFNECSKDKWVRAAIDVGFNIVMPDDPRAAPGEFRRRVARLARYAHAKGVAIEAGLDEIPCAANGRVNGGAVRTDVQEAVEFVNATGVDLLGVSVGNVHIQLKGQQALDLGRLKQLARAVKAGLVLHGGTGIPLDDLRQAVGLGVVKVNFGTYLKQAWLKAARPALARKEKNPHRLLGMGGPEDALMIGRKAVKDAVLTRLEALRCVGKGSAYSR